MSLFYPSDGRTVLTLTDGYHHYMDTGICTEKHENKYFFIDGATVRLIRLGSSLEMKFKTFLYNVFITVNSGELWYLNIGSEIDEFDGALTVLFNNGTAEQFVSDYSKGKLNPRGGRYFIYSPLHRGACLLCGDAAGHFLVSGAKCAYAISADGNTVHYSICSSLTLTPGAWNIYYTERFSTALLPPCPSGKKWYDDKTGTVTPIEDTLELTAHVRPDAPTGGDGSAEHPFRSLRSAAELLAHTGGTVYLYGKVPYEPLPPYRSAITFSGATEDAELIFEKNIRYYLQGDTVFERMRLTFDASEHDRVMLITNGHNLIYGKNLTTYYGILTGTGSLSAGARSIRVSKIDSILSAGSYASRTHAVMLLLRDGRVGVECGGKSLYLTPSSPVVIPPKTEYTLVSERNDAVSVLAVGFAGKEKDAPTQAYSVEAGADAYFGERFARYFDESASLSTPEAKKELSYAAERILGLSGVKRSTVQKLHDFIHENYAAIPSVAFLAEHFHLNRSYIQRAYKKTFGVGLKQELTRVRCDAAKMLLHKGYSVNETARLVGYDSVSSFSRAFHEETGLTPKQTSIRVNQ